MSPALDLLFNLQPRIFCGVEILNALIERTLTLNTLPQSEKTLAFNT